MKNNRLTVIVGGLFALVVLAFGSQLFNRKPQENVAKQAKVGVLQFVTHDALDEIYRGIKDGLQASGYREGDNLNIDFLNSEADQSKVQTMSQTLINKGNQVLVGIATPAAQGLASATKDIPIVMGAVTDPVGAKLVKDLTAPDGNVTGVSDKTPIAAQLELMAQLTPTVKTVGVLYSSSEDNSASQVETFKRLAQDKGYEVVEYAVASSNDITSTANVMVGKVDAIFLPLDNTIASAFTTVVQVAKETKKPIYTSVDTMVAEGGLASVFINQYELGVATGQMVAKLLQGQKVSDLPVEVFDQGTPIINERVAAELGISIPEALKTTAQLVK